MINVGRGVYAALSVAGALAWWRQVYVDWDALPNYLLIAEVCTGAWLMKAAADAIDKIVKTHEE